MASAKRDRRFDWDSSDRMQWGAAKGSRRERTLSRRRFGMAKGARFRQRRDQLVQLNWLNDVRVEAGGMDALNIAMHGTASDGNGADGAGELAQGLEKIAAVAVRQMDVEHGDIGPRAAHSV